jgi:hypothetical protein
MNEITTTDFSRFGWRERKMAAQLLTTSCEQGFPEGFEDNEVQIMMNFNSGNVFFTNSEYQVCMMNGDDLEIWHTLPYSGEEGFAEDLKNLDIDTLNQEDIDYLVSYGIIEEPEEAEEAEEEEDEENEEE